MNDLIVKEVEFNGAQLMAVRDKRTGKIHVGVSWVCRGIGFNKDEKDRQVKNVQSDIVLKQGCVKFDAGVFDPNNSTLAIELDFLPLWLAKISITPKMQEEQPELTENLVTYQLRVKDILAQAFIKKPKCMEDIMIFQLEEMKSIKEQLSNVETRQFATEQNLNSIKDIVALRPNSWREDSKNLFIRMAEQLGGNEYIRDLREESYRLLDARMGVSVKTRLTNMRKNQAENGVCKSSRDKLNALDVIGCDRKLIEGYIAIVKEMCIKYGVSLIAK